MWIPTAIGYTFSLLLSVWGIQFYINVLKRPIYFSVPVVLAVFIPISIIFLMPLDYVQHNAKDAVAWLDLPDVVILYLWKVKYWTTFLLTWLVLPLLQEFYKSGQHKGYSRLREALQKNLRFQLTILAVSVVGVIYLSLEVGLSFGHMKSMIIALSHIYPLVLALWLMAHGLVNIPRDQWTFGSVVGNLNFHYLKVPKLIDDLEDVKIAFKEDILQVLVLQKNFTHDSEDLFVFRDWILEMYQNIPEDLKEVMELQYVSEAPAISRNQLTSGFMTKLTARFNSNLHKLVAYESAFNTLYRHVILYEDLLTTTSGSPQFRLDTASDLVSPRTKYLLHCYVYPVLNRAWSIMLFGAAFVVIESELFHSTKLSLINMIFTRIHHNWVQLVVCWSVFSLMLICAMNSLTKLKVFSVYHLVPHQSDPVSACFYATYIARLTIPLSYNFITLFVSRKSIFEDWFGKSIHLTGLFNLMNNWIPRLIVLPVVLTVFNVYDKLKRRLGLASDLYDSFGFDDVEDVENQPQKRKDLIIVEAKRIISREYTKRMAGNVRHFNLQQAADLNYNVNRTQFTAALSNRIDEPYHDEESSGSESIWGRLGSQWSNLTQQLPRWSDRGLGRRRGSSAAYEDEPLDQFDYDDDADSPMVI
ncbi:hypothetical protein PSN45_003745 [Yamadazyma tenuis]|uniref:LMBR1-domain-containing protein n=1 Tax=Candida tenuis (strain ATCC 10573 / BCRC 21748 / CBS 615 / JCM 9827 / NBRC 10315 / NRRL Y-1498 / VKM Y-70) TaxID=590646 RepID=G3B3E8_CANTC|nr:uncharacterized protein CANTEDRAFT_122366 [Yamadazyma tenuis ATCC 10573]EGV64149.1 hypothetical protein CANTEDRAFT_122366 [Yamadazyma tenuis ATCC 10573]WEJ96209.1 hypothetical protein PSN45_003745 [Yamadazyma tenuis]